MPIRISVAAAYRYVGPVWVIRCYVITILYNDVPTDTYCSISCYPFPLEDGGIRVQL